MKEQIKILADRNGMNESYYVIEESSELIKELIKYKRGFDNKDKIVEECADVLLTINILLTAMGISDEEVNNIMTSKAIRAVERGKKIGE
jgi:NTP pyrophosphatase (non-canonical NTP hydrolase)